MDVPNRSFSPIDLIDCIQHLYTINFESFVYIAAKNIHLAAQIGHAEAPAWLVERWDGEP